jgi:hypothetical protein
MVYQTKGGELEGTRRWENLKGRHHLVETDVDIKVVIKWIIQKWGGGSRDSSVSIATGYGLDDPGEREFESR